MKASALSALPRATEPQGHSHAIALVDSEIRAHLIAEAAYYRSQKRNFAPGHELDDWLAAEVEVDMGMAICVVGI